jgi:hypothetical protein
VSINKYSPGRAGCIFPYGSAGRAAMSRLRFVLLAKSVNVGHSPEALRTLPLFCVVSVALLDFVSSGTPFAPECIADAYWTTIHQEHPER